MKNAQFTGLEGLPELKVGQSITLTGVTADQVRDHMKTDESYSGVGNRVMDVGDSIVVVVRTKGRVSKQKEALIDVIKNMHPFQRLILNDTRIDYARSVIREYNEENGTNVLVRENVEKSKESGNVIEIFHDVFDANCIPRGHKWTLKELVDSFVSVVSEQFDYKKILEFQIVNSKPKETAKKEG